MLNPLSYLSKFFGSSNQKELNKIQKIVEQVNLVEKSISYLPNEDFPKKTYAVGVGDVVFFPSSVFHRTIPFNSNEERICIAFDVKPQLM